LSFVRLEVDAVDASGTSAFLYTVARKDMPFTKLIIESKSANVNLGNSLGVTPLMTAAMNHDEAMCLYLVSNGTLSPFFLLQMII
jgi:ankyrin repeat protein